MKYLYDSDLEFVKHVLDRLSHITFMSSKLGGDILYKLGKIRTDGAIPVSCEFPDGGGNVLLMFNGAWVNKDWGGFQNKHQNDNDSWYNIQIGADAKDDFADYCIDTSRINREFPVSVYPKDLEALVEAILDRLTRKFMPDMAGEKVYE